VNEALKYGRGRHSFWQLEKRGSGKKGRIKMNLNIVDDLKMHVTMVRTIHQIKVA